MIHKTLTHIYKNREIMRFTEGMGMEKGLELKCRQWHQKFNEINIDKIKVSKSFWLFKPINTKIIKFADRNDASWTLA